MKKIILVIMLSLGLVIPLQAQEIKKDNLASVKRIQTMEPGFDFNGILDSKIFTIKDKDYGLNKEKLEWYFYPKYQILLSKVLAKKNIGLFVDVEKPGYTGENYPTLEINQLYAKFIKGIFCLKIGRQTFGDREDLLLGLQNDAISLGLNMPIIDLTFFIADSNFLNAWQGRVEGLIGFIPTLRLKEEMFLKGYLLLGSDTVEITTNQGEVKNNINKLLTVGGRYTWAWILNKSMSLDLNTQIGLQFAKAKSIYDKDIQTNALGFKLDTQYTLKQDKFAINLGVDVVYTTGNPDLSEETRVGFMGANNLDDTGPGLFTKIEDGGGNAAFLDTFTGGDKIKNYMGLLALGLKTDINISRFEPGLGFWFYSDTDKAGKELGIETDQWLLYHFSDTVTFYQELALFKPSDKSQLVKNNKEAGIKPVIKFVIGTAIIF